MPDPKKYRSEYWNFQTPKGMQKKLVCVLSGEKERERMLKKAQDMAKANKWRLR